MNVSKKISKAFMSGPIYIIFFGLIFFVVGAWPSYKQFVFERNGVETQGIVTGMATNCVEDGCSYAPVVDFQTQSGESITFESMYSSNPPAYDTDEEVVVIYPLEDPENAEIKGGGSGVGITFIIIGGIIMLFGFSFFFLWFREILAKAQVDVPVMDEATH